MPSHIKLHSSEETVLTHVYLAWVDTWLLSSAGDANSGEGKADMTLEEIASYFKNDDPLRILDHGVLERAVSSFRKLHRERKITYAGDKPPSCSETDVLSESYDPRTSCTCDGFYPIPSCDVSEEFLQKHQCQAIRDTLRAMKEVIDRPDEWNAGNLFTPDKLRGAARELILANGDEKNKLDTCQGRGMSSAIPEIQVPDRRPDPKNDMAGLVHRQIYPSCEQIKICSDARHYFVMSSAVSVGDHGISRAVADAGNDILIADYGEALDDTTLKILQRTGAAAMAFLKLCTLAGSVTEWQYANLVASVIQFRVLGHYRDHARFRLPKVIHGSRMTGWAVQRHIDLALFNAVMPASLASTQELSEEENMRLSAACALIADLADFRSDTFRNTRENVVVRGMNGNVCEYLDGVIAECLDLALAAIRTNELCALVIMAMCNWCVLGSQHKMYEIVSFVREVRQYPICQYVSETDHAPYEELLRLLSPYGSLGPAGPNLWKKRAEMDRTHVVARTSEDTHKAWLADMTRSFFAPGNLRKVVDVVHFEWSGHTGDIGYCP